MAWPLFKTDPTQTKALTSADWTIAALASLVALPSLFGALAITLAAMFPAANNGPFNSPIGYMISTSTIILVSPVICSLAYLACVPMLIAATKFGRLGLATFVVFSGLVLLISTVGMKTFLFRDALDPSLVDIALVLLPASVLAPIVFWLTLRMRNPQAFGAPAISAKINRVFD